MRILVLSSARVFVLTLLPFSLVHSAPYAEYRNDAKFSESSFDKAVNYLRVGYKFKNNIYFEAGPKTHGSSAEVGYSFKLSDVWGIKGKWEAGDTGSLAHKLETEVRAQLGILPGAYFEYKNVAAYTNSNFKGNDDHFRLGFKFKSNVYLEIGPRDRGSSGEIGYKYALSDRWTLKGKWEANDTSKFKHKLETELRVTF
jgi:hypothetical protein